MPHTGPDDAHPLHLVRSVAPRTPPTDVHGARSTLDDTYAVAPDYSHTCSPTGFFAIIAKEGTDSDDPYTEPEPVHFFGADHAPIIFWQGAFQDATGLAEYRGLRRGRKIVSVLPGDGWTVQARLDDGFWEEPVIGWAVTDTGSCLPLIRQDHPTYPLATAPADEVFPEGFTLALLPAAGAGQE